MFYVYILQCNDNSFYTGHTDDLDKRLAQHTQAYFNNCYTANRLPVVLVYQGEFDTRERALIVEKQVKDWSRKKKQALINDDWDEIIRLSK
jgi:putative endonuclease